VVKVREGLTVLDDLVCKPILCRDYSTATLEESSPRTRNDSWRRLICGRMRGAASDQSPAVERLRPASCVYVCQWGVVSRKNNWGKWIPIKNVEARFRV
jgi:hypothetical protein